MLQHLFPGYNYVLMDPVVDIENAREDPEIQYAPEVVSAIKRRIDKTRKPGQYILTGSQQWGVMKNLSESLAGRAVILELFPFSLGEISLNPPEEPWLARWLKDPEAFYPADSKLLQLPMIPYEHIWTGFCSTNDLGPGFCPLEAFLVGESPHK